LFEIEWTTPRHDFLMEFFNATKGNKNLILVMFKTPSIKLGTLNLVESKNNCFQPPAL
jgi:hypothetical protein